MSSLKSSRGSVLVFSLIILSIILSAAITVATVSVTNQRSASSTGKSVQSFQVADSGIELALQKIYKGNYATLNALATGMGGAASCTGGAISKNNVVGGSIKVSFYDNDGNLVTCTDTAWRDKVVRIKSEGAAFGTTRVVETAVAAKKPLKKKVLSVGFNYGCSLSVWDDFIFCRYYPKYKSFGRFNICRKYFGTWIRYQFRWLHFIIAAPQSLEPKSGFVSFLRKYICLFSNAAFYNS